MAARPGGRRGLIDSGPSRAPRIAYVLGVTGLLVAGGAALLASTASERELASFLEARLPEILGYAPRPERLAAYAHDLRLSLRGLGIAAIAGAIALLAARRRLEPRLASGLGRARVSAAELARAAGSFSAPRWELRAVAGLTVAALLLRLALLFEPVRYDEALTYLRGGRSLAAALGLFPDQNNHVLNSLGVFVTSHLLGADGWSLRLTTLAAGVALVPATYLVGRAHYDGVVGVVAAGLVAASSPLIEYSVNARGYALAAVFAMALFVVAPYLAREGNGAGWALFVLIAVLGMYSVPTTAYAVAAVTVWLAATMVVERRPIARRLAAALVAIAALTALLYSPALLLGQPGVTSNDDWVTDPAAWLGDAVGFWLRDLPAPLAALLGAGALASIVLHRRLSRERVPVLAPVAAVLLVAVAAGRAVEYQRAWIPLLPVLLVACAAGLGALRTRVPGRAAAVAAGGLAIAAAGATFALAGDSIAGADDVRAPSVATVLRTQLGEDDLVLAQFPFDVLLRYEAREDRARILPAQTPDPGAEVARAGTVVLVAARRPGREAERDRIVRAYGPARRLRQLDTATILRLERRDAPRRDP